MGGGGGSSRMRSYLVFGEEGITHARQQHHAHQEGDDCFASHDSR